MTATLVLDAEVIEPVPGAPEVSVPTLVSRGIAAALEPLTFLLVALVIALVEYFVAGPLTDFGLSNFWLAFVVMAAWNGWQWAGAQTALGALNGHSVAMVDGTPACFLCIAVRQFARFGVLYGLPVLALDLNLGLLVALFAATGVVIWQTTDGRAPWDLVAGTVVTNGFDSAGEIVLPPVTSAADLVLDPDRVRDNRRARWMLLAAGLSSVVVSALIVWNIFSEALEFVTPDEFDWGLLRGIGWLPRRGVFDISTLLVGTLWVTGIAVLVAGPIGLGVAIYLSEYASPRVRGIVKPLIETLASIPSVVLGLFAISFIRPNVLKPVFADIGIFSLLAAGLGVGILTIPIVASIAEDAMRAVPQELREASYGLGGRRVTTALRVVFPAALSGISAAFIVAVSRAIGETMVVYIAAGGSGGAIFESNPLEDGQTFTAAMASLGAGTDSVAGSGLAFQSLYFLGALLFILTLVLNLVSDIIVRRFRQVY